MTIKDVNSWGDGELLWMTLSILKLIDKYGYPEDPVYDSIKGIFPKDKPINQYLKYIEAHVWSDDALDKYRLYLEP